MRGRRGEGGGEEQGTVLSGITWLHEAVVQTKAVLSGLYTENAIGMEEVVVVVEGERDSVWFWAPGW